MKPSKNEMYHQSGFQKRRRSGIRRTSTWFPSHAAASSGLGVDPEVVKRASDLGCPAFSGGRVHRATFKKWIADHPSELLAATGSKGLRDEVLKQQARRLRLANDLKEGRLVLRALVSETHARILGRFRFELEQKLRNEFPMAVAGQDVPSCRIYGTRLADQLMAILYDMGAEWKA